jgi:hypothetical protein
LIKGRGSTTLTPANVPLSMQVKLYRERDANGEGGCCRPAWAAPASSSKASSAHSKAVCPMGRDPWVTAAGGREIVQLLGRSQAALGWRLPLLGSAGILLQSQLSAHQGGTSMGRDPWVTVAGGRELVQVLVPEPGRGG